MNKKVLIVGNNAFVKQIHDILIPLDIDISWANTTSEVKESISKIDIDFIIIDADGYQDNGFDTDQDVLQLIVNSKKRFLFVSSKATKENIQSAAKLGCSDYILRSSNRREFIAHFNSIIHDKTRITCIGGGTGLFTLLLGLKKISNVMLSSIVTMSDDGGSSGKLRDAMGILPPGDIRRSLVALSNAPEVMNEIMQYRFNKASGLEEHSFGNLFLAALNDITGSMADAVKMLGDILNVQGVVLPVTSQITKLSAEFEDETIIRGESNIDLVNGRDESLHIKKLWHEPEAECGLDVYASLVNSDIITIGPGDLFTSIVANLTIKGLSEAIVTSRAKKVYVCNLMTKPGETWDYSAVDHIREIVQYLGKDCLDTVIISNSALTEQSTKEYVKKNQKPVAFGDLEEIHKITKAEIVLADIGNQTDLVRHDSQKLKTQIEKLL